MLPHCRNSIPIWKQGVGTWSEILSVIVTYRKKHRYVQLIKAESRSKMMNYWKSRGTLAWDHLSQRQWTREMNGTTDYAPGSSGSLGTMGWTPQKFVSGKWSTAIIHEMSLSSEVGRALRKRNMWRIGDLCKCGMYATQESCRTLHWKPRSWT